MNQETIKKTIRDSHESALQKAKLVLPEMDVMTVIKLVYDISTGKKELKDVKAEWIPILESAGIAYAKEMSENLLVNALKNSDNESLKKLGTRKFADKLVNSARPAGIAVQKYCKGEIDLKEFIESLNNAGVLNVGNEVARAFGHDLSGLENSAEALLKISMPAAAYASSMAAYKMCMEALNEAHLVHDERVRIQNQCNESIAMIGRYRTDMEQSVEKYLHQYMTVFNTAMAAMDQAIIDDDPDGYISSCNEITTMMGHDVQFDNMDEFDSFMDSDESLKL